MSPAPLRLDIATARRFHRAAVALDTPLPDVPAALRYHGYVQIDPINVCGRMHDLILRNRVAGYREGDLMRHLHGPTDAPLPAEQRTAFEHHHPATGILVAFPLEAWPHLLGAMKARTRRTGAWSGRLTPRERALAPRLLEEIAARGPLGSEEFASHGKARAAWGAATLAKATLQKLFFHGRLLIARRENGRRLYDLPERVLPAATLASPAAPADTTLRWIAELTLRQRRLVLLKRRELAAVADLVQPLAVEGLPTLHCLRTDLPLLARCATESPPPDAPPPESAAPRLLAPLDPLIYDRRITSVVWGFDYTWEVYTPPAKRARGYYALPLLAGHELAGHVDPKADRQRGKLVVVSRSVRRGVLTAPAVAELARFLGLQ